VKDFVQLGSITLRRILRVVFHVPLSPIVPILKGVEMAVLSALLEQVLNLLRDGRVPMRVRMRFRRHVPQAAES
jgi:hypothetical protein